MTYKLISVVGDGVTREWTLDNELVDGYSVLVDGSVVVFTQPAWNRVKMATAPAAGSNVTFKVKELASTDASGSTGGTGSADVNAIASAVAAAVQVPSAAAIATAVASQVVPAVASAVDDTAKGEVKLFGLGAGESIPAGWVEDASFAKLPESLPQASLVANSWTLANSSSTVYTMEGTATYCIPGAIAMQKQASATATPVALRPTVGWVGAYVPQIATLNSKVMQFSGSLNTSTAPSQSLYEIDTTSGVLTTLANAPEGRCRAAMAAPDNNTLVVLGGGVSLTYWSSTVALKYTRSTNTWTSHTLDAAVPALPIVAKLPSGKFFVGGGVDNNGVPLTAYRIFDPVTMSFTTAAKTMPYPVTLSWTSVAFRTAKGCAYFCSGTGPNIVEYDESTDSFAPMSVFVAPSFMPLGSSGSAFTAAYDLVPGQEGINILRFNSGYGHNLLQANNLPRYTYLRKQ